MRTLTFTFDESALGILPTHAGIVWTDAGFSDGGLGFGHGQVVFEAYDHSGDLLVSIGPMVMGDGYAGGQTDEDRFFGVSISDGISAIAMRMPDSADFEVDHLQYGVPEPSSALLLLAGAMLASMGSRRWTPTGLPLVAIARAGSPYSGDW